MSFDENLKDENLKSEDCNCNGSNDPNGSQTHVHEFEGSTRLAEQGAERHNHRFAGVTSEVIPMGNSHVHAILTNTDFFEDHHHELGVTTGLAINVGGGKHIHLATGVTTIDDGHNHSFIFTTLIQDPLT
ncbi:YmaF family protein [Clostridium sp. MSJ-11]|uniref:YmaF family protein n=1 Tax=Clostridium mobile TaxID=2841512 RepID=A0ABS6EIT2_9CLOT|nr:YmaF family protein [Clostridium mobile]MBU5484345.1 YmaF family protein [Clostridium mobile]